MCCLIFCSTTYIWYYFTELTYLTAHSAEKLITFCHHILLPITQNKKSVKINILHDSSYFFISVNSVSSVGHILEFLFINFNHNVIASTLKHTHKSDNLSSILNSTLKTPIKVTVKLTNYQYIY